MKVLNINKFFYMRGGVERYFFALTKLLKDHNHEVVHFSMEDERNYPTKDAKYFVPNVEIGNPGLKLLNKALRPIWYKEAQRAIERLILEEKPDIAHIHMLYHHLSPSLLPVLKKHGIPVVMTVHDYKLICPNYLLFTEDEVCKRCKGHKYYQAILHNCLKESKVVSAYGALEMTIHKFMQVYEKHVDVFIAPSKFVQETLIEFGQNPKKIMTIPHFVDPAFLDMAKSVQPMKAKRPYALYFGRLAKEKGVDKILEMMYINKPGIDLKIAGNGPLQEELQDFVLDNDLEGVEFLGHLDAKKLISYIKGAQAVLMPSRFYEPFGFAALETMALGTPLIASRSGALADIVSPELGKLFERDNLDEMAAALQEVMTWDKQALAPKAKQEIESHYLPEQHYRTLHTVYEHLLS